MFDHEALLFTGCYSQLHFFVEPKKNKKKKSLKSLVTLPHSEVQKAFTPEVIPLQDIHQLSPISLFIFSSSIPIGSLPIAAPNLLNLLWISTVPWLQCNNTIGWYVSPSHRYEAIKYIFFGGGGGRGGAAYSYTTDCSIQKSVSGLTPLLYCLRHSSSNILHINRNKTARASSFVRLCLVTAVLWAQMWMSAC